jgi:hypothetical protein
MARNLVLALGDEQSEFSIKPLNRADIYGKRKRVALDADGQVCSRASLLDDGSLLLKSGMTAQGYFTSDGKSYKQADLAAFDASGKPLEKVPSTLGVAQKLSGPLPAETVLDLRVDSIYLLEAAQLGDKLSKSLAAGEIYGFSFNYRDDYSAESGVLLGNENGFFALIGKPVEWEWSSLGAVADLPASDADADEELDFEMF